jgi:hypothetical protein
VATKAVDTSSNVRGWQITLVVAGAILIAGGAVLQVVISRLHSTTVVTKTAHTTTTVTGPSPPPTALVTTVLGAGVVLLIVGALFSKISKIVLTGIGEIDLGTQADIAGKAAAATNDPGMAMSLVSKTNEKVLTSLASTGTVTTPTTKMVDDAFSAAKTELGIT